MNSLQIFILRKELGNVTAQLSSFFSNYIRVLTEHAELARVVESYISDVRIAIKDLSKDQPILQATHS